MADQALAKTLRLSKLEEDRNFKRKRLEDLNSQKLAIEAEMRELESELERMDQDIDTLDLEIAEGHQQSENSMDAPVNSVPIIGRNESTGQPQPLSFASASSTTPPNNNVGAPASAVTQQSKEPKRPSATLDTFLGMKRSVESPNIVSAASTDPLNHSTTATAAAPLPPASRETLPQPTNHDPNALYSRDSFPWSQQLHRELSQTFGIQRFRENQREIINATLSGVDVFCVMRTGGGKSLTYQLPSLIEGHGPQRKITFVISPLISLMQDQEMQMNEFVPHSAVSFMSGIGVSEHSARWNRVQDPTAGVCLVLVTPEKIEQSKKILGELEKLFGQGRLGRFVIDEAHCASQWGHDFRPDYAKLGKLKAHFPDVPILAVTATASEQVRQSVCDILRLRNYRFFRSSAARPNLTYSVRHKPKNFEDIAEWIRGQNGAAGIIYTLSRNDANTVAKQLRTCGITAEAYHSDISNSKKESIHWSWMKNETQVVVATIAFGLGINKPDVRFVLHHSISKTLEAYYQESGRAGRDGNPAECILFYSPKDVVRMMKLVHGTSSERLLIAMIRYAQEFGGDAICKAILLRHLEEPNCPDIRQLQRDHEGETTTSREVGRHVQVAARLLQIRIQEGKKMTMAKLVQDWRSRSDDAPQCVKDFPPAKDGISSDECEHIIVSMIIEKILDIAPVWGAYDTVIYLKLGDFGDRLLQANNPSFCLRLPNDRPKPKTTKATRNPSAGAGNGEWLSTKGKKRKAQPKAKRAPAKPKQPTKKKQKKRTTKSPTEVIDLIDDVSSSSSEEDVVRMPAVQNMIPKSILDDSSDEEEFQLET